MVKYNLVYCANGKGEQDIFIGRADCDNDDNALKALSQAREILKGKISAGEKISSAMIITEKSTPININNL